LYEQGKSRKKALQQPQLLQQIKQMPKKKKRSKASSVPSRNNLVLVLLCV